MVLVGTELVIGGGLDTGTVDDAPLCRLNSWTNRSRSLFSVLSRLFSS